MQQLIATFIFTIVLTSLIVQGRSWIKRNKERYPVLYKSQTLINFILLITFNSGDL
jgi:hypothetical protein